MKKKKNLSEHKIGMKRSNLIVLLILVQLSFLAIDYLYFSQIFMLLIAVADLLNFFFIINVVASDKNPSHKISWLLILFIFAPIGGLFYILWSDDFVDRKTAQKIRAVTNESQKYINKHRKVLKKAHSQVGKDFVYLQNTTGYMGYDKTKTYFLPTGEKKFEVLLQELAKAKEYIFIEYFIIADGYMLDEILKILKQKVTEGVDVRMILDDGGSGDILSKDTLNRIKEYGIQIYIFNKLRPMIDFFMNYRDHRKIVVIDGYTSFTGGNNIADEYINKIKLHGHWKDISIMLKGDATYSFNMMFLRQWEIVSGQKVDYDKYEPIPAEFPEGYAFPYCDGPYNGRHPGQGIYLSMINSAQKYLYIQSPYLIPDNEIITALKNCALSGVDVRIITPSIPDKWYVHPVTRSYYPRLMKAGVKIYEYSPGFIHAKVFCSDDKTAIIGTINTDYRSLYINYEDAVYVSHCQTVVDAKIDFWDTLKVSKRCTPENIKQSLWQKALSAVLNVFAPLM